MAPSIPVASHTPSATPRRAPPHLVAAGTLLVLCAKRSPQHHSSAAEAGSADSRAAGATACEAQAARRRAFRSTTLGDGFPSAVTSAPCFSSPSAATPGVQLQGVDVDAATPAIPGGPAVPVPAALPKPRSRVADKRRHARCWGNGGQAPQQQTQSSSSAIPRRALPLFGAAAREFLRNPFGYLTIPLVAAIVGYGTNWVGVKMIFYPIGFWGLPIRRWPEQPLGLIGWQGIVPAKVRKMSARLVDIITMKLLSAKEAFAKIDPNRLAVLLEPSIIEAVEKDAPWGEAWLLVIKPNVRNLLTEISKSIQKDIDSLLDLREVVGSAFLSNKVLLGELFQKAGREELRFLVDSGFGFGFILGLIQMWLWILFPNNWVLPVGGALVGYITNWVAIKLIFEPVEPTPVGPFVLQGLFQKRQPEVSLEFSEFLDERVLTSPRLIDNMVNGRYKDRFEAMVQAHIPSIVPAEVVQAAIGGFRKLADEPCSHPVHQYVGEKLELKSTLTVRLKALSSAEFENLLHPVFEEDEIILIIAGGVLGAAAGFVQMVFGWGGPPSGAASAVAAAAATTVADAGAVTSTGMLLPMFALCRLWWVAAVAVAGARAARLRLRRLAWRRFFARAASSDAAAAPSAGVGVPCGGGGHLEGRAARRC